MTETCLKRNTKFIHGVGTAAEGNSPKQILAVLNQNIGTFLSLINIATTTKYSAELLQIGAVHGWPVQVQSQCGAALDGRR